MAINAKGKKYIGKILEINWRTTRLLIAENNLILVPNTELSIAVVENFSKPNSITNMEIDLIFDFTLDEDRILRVLETALLDTLDQGVLLQGSKPRAQLKEITLEGIKYNLSFDVDMSKGSPGKFKHSILQIVLKYLRQANLKMN